MDEAGLYREPLERFIAARDALAKELKSAGDAAAAARVKALRKPSVAAWGIDQLPAEHAALLGELVDASARLRDAQRAVLSGGGSPDAMHDAARDERALVEELTVRAVAILQAAEHNVTEALREKVTDTLLAAASDPAMHDALRAGMLDRDLRRAGFGEFPGLTLVPREERPPKDQRAAERRAERERQVEELERIADESEREAEKLASIAARARTDAERKRKHADSARAELDGPKGE